MDKNTIFMLLLTIRKYSHLILCQNILLLAISLNCIYNSLTLLNILNIKLNRIGVGEKSEILTTKTQGVEPTIPEPQSFLEVSPGSVTLHLNAWENGGCPIVYFVVEYKPRYFSNISRLPFYHQSFIV